MQYPGGTIITAHAALSRALRHDYDACRRAGGARWWESADILPYSGWLRRLWQECVCNDPLQSPVLLSPVQEQVLWEEIIRASAEGHPLLDVPATASGAARAWDLLHAYEAPLDEAAYAGVPDAEAFFSWMRTLRGKLQDHGWITAGELARALYQRAAMGLLHVDQVVYAGFDELAPADARLFAALQISPWEPPRVENSRACRVEAHSTAEELTAAAAWARSILEERPSARIGLIVPGLAQHAAAVERIFDDALHPGLSFETGKTRRAFEIAAGEPLADCPVIAAALLLLALPEGMPLAEASALLRSAYSGLSRTDGARLDADLRRYGIDHVTLGLDIVRRRFPGFAKASAERKPRRAYPGEWSAIFSKLLSAAGWPGDRELSRGERGALDAWKDLLSDFAALDSILPRFTYEEALASLRRLIRGRRLATAPYGAPVQILDLGDAAGARFDALWIAGFHAQAWPEPLRPNPFLPVSLQRAAGMPHCSAERELQRARRATSKLVRAAREVVFSSPRYSGEEPLRPSPLIAHLPEFQPPAPADTALARVFSAAIALEALESDPAPPLEQAHEQAGGMSVLKDQAACPFRAFARHRLQARALDELEIGVSPRERGNLAHDALRLFWAKTKSHDALNALSPDGREAEIRAAVRAALDAKFSRRPKTRAAERFRDLEQSRLEKLISEWLDRERARDPFEVVELEVPHETDVFGLRLKLKADRVDRYADGAHAIIDYKTSKNVSAEGWGGDRPDEPQLPLYAVKSGFPVSEVAFGKLLPGGCGIESCSGEQLQARFPEWQRVLRSLAEAYLEGRAEVDPKRGSKTCELCDLQPLCRIGDVIRAEDAGVNAEQAGE